MVAATSDKPASPSEAAQATIASVSGEGPGETIGRYKLLQLIGEGGFGSVWLAEQREPVQRRVALKIIKLGMDTKQVVARFEAERQALAILDHPNIAKVLDAGSTTTGRPYFVMEYIDGVPIVEYCDDERLNTKARLTLFMQVCRAIQHAHQKGIIHRDIKPGNILVMLHDQEPVPRVIDFGIAKATQTALTQKTLFTEYRQMIGTPAYMSPEQAGATGLDVDTRADIYSLGVLLYELLTGTTPFDTATLMEAGFAEMMRIIRDEEPPRPSTRVSTTRETLAGLAAKRHTEPHKLGNMIRGELDWIVMKAIEKERARRYDTASALADDIQRFLVGAAVSAAPPSTVYRVRKFVRRNRAGVIAAGLIGVSLLAGMVAFAWQAQVAEHQRDLAQTERTNARDAEARAEARAQELQMVSEFQSQMLDQIALPVVGRQLTVDMQQRLEETLDRTNASDETRQALSAGLDTLWEHVNATDVAVGVIDRAIFEPSIKTLDATFAEQPEVDARLRQALAARYREFGLFDVALPLQRKALETRRAALGEAHPDTLQSLVATALLVQRMGRSNEAVALHLEVLEKRRDLLGKDHPDTLDSLETLGFLFATQNRFDEAERYRRECMQGRKNVLGAEHANTLAVTHNLAELLGTLGRHDEAEVYFREVLDGRMRILGEAHSNTILTQIRLAANLEAQKKYTEARMVLQDALHTYEREMARQRSGERTDFQTAGGLSSRIGFFFHIRGDFARAERFLRDSVEIKRRHLGEEHQFALSESMNLGSTLVELDRLDEAEALIFPALRTSQRTLGSDNSATRRGMRVTGYFLHASGKSAEAEPYYARVLALDRALHSTDHRHIATDLLGLAMARHTLGRTTEARDLFDEAIDMFRRLNPNGSASLARALWLSGVAWMDEKAWASALDTLTEAVALGEQFLSPDHPHLAEYRTTLETCRDDRDGKENARP